MHRLQASNWRLGPWRRIAGVRNRQKREPWLRPWLSANFFQQKQLHQRAADRRLRPGLCAARRWRQPRGGRIRSRSRPAAAVVQRHRLVYNALDLLNIGPPGRLRYALAQLDGEIDADVSSVSIGVGKMFVDVMRDQTQLARSSATPVGGEGWRPWVSGFGGAGGVSGNGDAHSVNFGGGGAAGADYRFGPNLQAGLALGYMQSSFGTTGYPAAAG